MDERSSLLNRGSLPAAFKGAERLFFFKPSPMLPAAHFAVAIVLLGIAVSLGVGLAGSEGGACQNQCASNNTVRFP